MGRFVAVPGANARKGITKREDKMQQALYEKYRPKTWAELIGNEKAKSVIAFRREHGGICNEAFWVKGKSGSGKTCIARLIAAEFGDPMQTVEIPGPDLSADRLREVISSWGYCTWSGKPHVLIVNEAHLLTKLMISRFLDLLEQIGRGDLGRVIVLFTSTLKGDKLFEEQLDSAPFKSRCIELTTIYQNAAEPFAKRCKEIAMAERMDGKPLEAYIQLAKDCENNFRMMLETISAGGMS